MSFFTRLFDWLIGDDDDEEEATVFLSRTLRVRLTDPERNLLPGGRCRIVGESTVYDLDGEGIAEIPLPGWCPSTIDVEWEPYDAASDPSGARFYWETTLDVSVMSASDEACQQRLDNLGFCGPSLSERVTAYETFLGFGATGLLASIKNDLLAWHDGQAPGSATGAGQSGAEETCHDLVRRIYAAFNDPGFLGLGGTDEDEVMAVLTIARDRGMMRELSALYAQEHPGELSLEAELDDELGGRDYRQAMELYRQGMAQ